MIISGAPGVEEEKSGDIFQGETGALLQKMLLSINIKSKNYKYFGEVSTTRRQKAYHSRN